MAHGVTNLDLVIKIEGLAKRSTAGIQHYSETLAFSTSIMTTRYVTPTNIVIAATDDRSGFTISYTTIYYVKT